MAIAFTLVKPVTAAEKCTDLPEKVSAAITSFNHSVRGAEYCEFRNATTGDMDGDGREDLVVRFTIEGACHEDVESTPGACGINYEFFLIALLAKNEELIPPVMVGGKGIRHIEALHIRQDKILLDTLEYADGDGLCCPSIKQNAAYQIKQGRLVEFGR